MSDLMDRSNECFFSDSDDDRHSSQSTTSVSDYIGEAQLPFSLRKLLNPTPTSVQQPIIPQTAGPRSATPPMTRPAKEDNCVGNDLTRFRPWKRLPPPRSFNSQPQIPLPPIYVCIPPSRASHATLTPCLPRSPQFSPYYFPAALSSRDLTGRVNHYQLPSECDESCKTYATQLPPLIITPSSSNLRPLSIGKSNDFQSITKKKLNISSQNAMTPRPDQQKASKKLNRSNDKERNRCLTCGSAFSTFANLTRHEKKCPIANSKSI